MQRIVTIVYYWMQQHYFTFRLLILLKEIGVTRRVNYIITHKDELNHRLHPTNEMIEAKKFFDDKDIKERLNKISGYLADEKSWKVINACIEYRTKKTPIPRGLFSEYDQYFVSEIVEISEGEVFIDGGAYTGDTIQQLLDMVKKRKKSIKRVIAFEPENDNYMLLQKFYGTNPLVKILKMGLSDGSKEIFFKSTGVTSKIVKDKNEATDIIRTVDIDSTIECKEATFIKMDIEGSEWEALHGAANTIIRNKPKLAICIYHSDEDMVRLIEYVHELVPEYRLYVRHHSKSEVETVLYAVL